MRQRINAFGLAWERVWQEDEALKHIDGENVAHAWRRFFGEELPEGKQWDERADENTTLRKGRRLLSLAPDGDSIWIPAYTCFDKCTCAQVSGVKPDQVKAVPVAELADTPLDVLERIEVLLEKAVVNLEDIRDATNNRER